MNDVVREVGGTLGVAVLGSIALAGALIAAAFLPARARARAAAGALPEPAAA